MSNQLKNILWGKYVEAETAVRDREEELKKQDHAFQTASTIRDEAWEKYKAAELHHQSAEGEKV